VGTLSFMATKKHKLILNSNSTFGKKCKSLKKLKNSRELLALMRLVLRHPRLKLSYKKILKNSRFILRYQISLREAHV